MTMFIKLSFLIFCEFLLSSATNILYISTLPSPSHHFWFVIFKLKIVYLNQSMVEYVWVFVFYAFFNRNSAIYNKLAERGHNVTVISPDLDKNPPAGVHYIHMENQYDDQRDELLKGMLSTTEHPGPFAEVLFLHQICINYCQSKI